MLKKFAQTIPTIPRPAPARERISTWGLLMWSYARQLAHRSHVVAVGAGASTSRRPGGGSSLTLTGTVCDLMASGGLMGAGHNGSAATCVGKAHPDAEEVVSIVRRHPLMLELERTAKAETPPPWDTDLEPLRVVPVLKASGKPEMIVDHNTRVGIACRIRIDGHSAEVRAIRQKEAREAYAEWFLALAEVREVLLMENRLRRWQVTGIGVEQEPWARRYPDNEA
jgi:hypothetical protein